MEKLRTQCISPGSLGGGDHRDQGQASAHNGHRQALGPRPRLSMNNHEAQSFCQFLKSAY